MKNLTLSLIALAFLFSCSKEEPVIVSGKIINGYTKEPMANKSLYFHSYSEIGCIIDCPDAGPAREYQCTTNANGEFSFEVDKNQRKRAFHFDQHSSYVDTCDSTYIDGSYSILILYANKKEVVEFKEYGTVTFEIDFESSASKSLDSVKVFCNNGYTTVNSSLELFEENKTTRVFQGVDLQPGKSYHFKVETIKGSVVKIDQEFDITIGITPCTNSVSKIIKL